jgi:translation initiation factor 3 subunit B
MEAADIDPLAIARDMYFEQPDGFPLEDFDIRDVQLPADEDFDVKSDEEEVDEEEVETETGFGSVIGECTARSRVAGVILRPRRGSVVVGNLPVVGPEKFERLNNVVKKVCALGVYEEGSLLPRDALHCRPWMA